MPPHLVELAAPIAQAMGALHQLERTQQIVPHADVALTHVRGALSQLQAQPTNHPAVAQALEAVAASLSLVHALTRLGAPQAGAPPAGVAPAAHAPAPHAPPHAPPPAPPTAPTTAAMPQKAPQPSTNAGFPAPSVQAQAQAQAQAQPAQAPPMIARDPFAAPPLAARPAPPPAGYGAGAQAPYVPPSAFAQTAQAAPAPPVAVAPATPSIPVPAPPNAGNLAIVTADLGAHSQTNFYKGLAGNDIIDHGGLFVSTYQLPKLGTALRLRVSLPGGYEFEANATVRWTREASGDAPPGFGAQFTAITNEARQLVYRYVRNREPLFHDDL